MAGYGTRLGIPAVIGGRQTDIFRDFRQAWEAKDISALIGLLDPGVMAIADGRRRRQRRAPPHRRGRARRALCRRCRPPGTRPDAPGPDCQRPARSGGSARRRHRGGIRVRARRRPDQAHQGSTQPGQAPALGGRLTRLIGKKPNRNLPRDLRQLCHRKNPRQPGNDQARRQGPGPACRHRLPGRPDPSRLSGADRVSGQQPPR